MKGAKRGRGVKHRPGEKRERVSPARRAAYDVLRRVEESDAFASVLLASNEDELSREDRALSYEIVLGVLRHELWLDYLIEHYTGRKASKLDAPVRRSLRMGLYQLRFLSRIPPSAVVNESVNLAHRARVRSAAGLINASLRRAVREPEYDPTARITDHLERIAVRHSHPLWLIKRWADWLGPEETERFAAANNVAPPVAFRVVRKHEEKGRVLDELRAAGASVEASKVAPGAWRISGASVMLRELAQRGRIYLQDEASQLVAHVLDAQAGERVLDVCAAPGSKTTHIATRTPEISLIVAGDVHEHRLRTVVEAGARQGIETLRAVVHNAAASLPFAEASFDRVLVDAPCTGTGTLRRNPEIRWRITARDILELSALQLRLLSNAARMVRRGGRLVYSTCSVEREENEDVISSFLKQDARFKQLLWDVPASLQADGDVARIWPHKQGADGFFIAAFERQS